MYLCHGEFAACKYVPVEFVTLKHIIENTLIQSVGRHEGQYIFVNRIGEFPIY